MAGVNVICVRHGQSIGNATDQDGRAALDIPNHQYPLTELGRKQVNLAGRWLQIHYGIPEVCFHSTFLRTQETAERVLEAWGMDIPIFTDERLDEKWDGIFHDLSKEEVAARYPEQLRLKERSGYYHYRPLGGENGPDVELRIRSFLADLRRMEARHFVLACHGRWLMFFQRVLLGMNLGKFNQLLKDKTSVFNRENASITIFRDVFGAEIKIESVNPWAGILEKVGVSFA